MAVGKDFIEVQINSTKKDLKIAYSDFVKSVARYHFHRGELAAYEKIMQFYQPIDKNIVSNN